MLLPQHFKSRSKKRKAQKYESDTIQQIANYKYFVLLLIKKTCLPKQTGF
jgi:hypothetical protein